MSNLKPMPGLPGGFTSWGEMNVAYLNGRIMFAEYQRLHREFHRTARSKHLTDAECASEYWRVEADMAGNAPTVMSPAVIRKHIRVWERFATHPHAHEGDD